MLQKQTFDFTLEAPPGYVLQSEDAVYAVERMQFEHWRAMSASEKAGLMDRHSAMIRELSLAGIRSRHPEASEADVWRMAGEIWLGPELYKRLVEPRLTR